jgi:hypothetical protein
MPPPRRPIGIRKEDATMKQPAFPSDIIAPAETDTSPPEAEVLAAKKDSTRKPEGIGEGPSGATATPLHSDIWIYRAVVIILGIVSIVPVVGGLVMAWPGKEIPESIIALGSAAVGAVAGLLAPSPARGG